MFEDLNIARLRFIMTMGCNFKCDYCFEGGKSDKHLTAEQCIALGKQVLNEMTQDKLTVQYFGGEPMLRFNDIKLTTEVLSLYAKKLGKKIQFAIITNGSICSDRIVKHFKQYNYAVSVSGDGLAEAHNLHRGYMNGQKDTFDRVCKTIKAFLEVDRNLPLSMVVTKQNVKYLKDSFDWAFKMGIRRFTVTAILDRTEYSPDPDEYLEQLLGVAEIAAGVEGLDETWTFRNKYRLIAKDNKDTVNIELNPIKMTIEYESPTSSVQDFGSHVEQNKERVSKETREKLLRAEEIALNRYRELKSK